MKGENDYQVYCYNELDTYVHTVMLSNEKFIGIVSLFYSREHYVYWNNHPTIILKDQFEAVQMKKKNRSNLVRSSMEIVGKTRNVAVKIENKKQAINKKL